MTLDKREGTTVRFFFHLDNQTSLYRWLYWNMRWTNEVLFLKVFGGGLPYTCHYNSRVFILDFNWNCCRLQEAKKFSRNPGQFKCVTRKTRYHVSIAELLIRNLWIQVVELVWRTRNMLKIPYFRGGHQIFQISPGIKSLYDQGRNLIHLMAGDT